MCNNNQEASLAIMPLTMRPDRWTEPVLQELSNKSLINILPITLIEVLHVQIQLH